MRTYVRVWLILLMKLNTTQILCMPAYLLLHLANYDLYPHYVTYVHIFVRSPALCLNH